MILPRTKMAINVLMSSRELIFDREVWSKDFALQILKQDTDEDFDTDPYKWYLWFIENEHIVAYKGYYRNNPSEKVIRQQMEAQEEIIVMYPEVSKETDSRAWVERHKILEKTLSDYLMTALRSLRFHLGYQLDVSFEFGYRPIMHTSLKNITGQDFGLDATKWEMWLLSPEAQSVREKYAKHASENSENLTFRIPLKPKDD
ncbi:MAG: hypothetical protein RLP44_27925 [Aggregatilineales bacterium]